jgi:predicted component of type VI protein secretion system
MQEPTPASNLKQHLSALHEHLAVTGDVDDDLRHLLMQLDGDIRALLERRASAAVPEAARLQAEEESTTYGLAERAQELSARFAAQHPRLEPALRELGNMLSNMGI